MKRDIFTEALCSSEKHPSIPDTDDIFAPMLGSWRIVWRDHFHCETPREVKGEWMFSRTLNGTAVQDVFIVPSRREAVLNAQPDAEYGTTVRIYNPLHGWWDVFYGCQGSAIRLTGQAEGDMVVITENEEGRMKWVFSMITEKGFIWSKMQIDRSGQWEVVAEVTAIRED